MKTEVVASNESTLPSDLSVIIVNWNTRELLAKCLESVAGDRDAAEIYVVDNASTDGSAQMVKERFPWVRLVEHTENIGARRLHTVMTTLLDDMLFAVPESRRKNIKVTAKMVSDKLEKIVEDRDLSRYIL